MNEPNLNKTADLLKVLANPTRLKLLYLLATKGPHSVTQLQAHLQLDQPAVSKHLSRLKAKGVVESQRRGQESHYQISGPLAESLLNLISVESDELGK